MAYVYVCCNGSTNSICQAALFFQICSSMLLISWVDGLAVARFDIIHYTRLESADANRSFVSRKASCIEEFLTRASNAKITLLSRSRT